MVTPGEKPTVVLDNGTGLLKAGFANESLPRETFPSIIGRPVLRSESSLRSSSGAGVKLSESEYMGDEAAQRRFGLQISYPVVNGIVQDWDEMTKIWKYAFSSKKLNVVTEGAGIMLTEAPMNPRKNREKMLEVVFETFGFDRFWVGVQAVLALYGQGLTTGLVVDSGDGVTHVVPVYMNYQVQHAIRRLNFAGRDITTYLIKLLQMKGHFFNRTADFETVREMKEKCCYCPLDIKRERQLARETTVLTSQYKLPDDRMVTLDTERFEAPEALFNPRLIEKEGRGLSEMVWDSIEASDIDLRAKLYKTIILSGGTTMLAGLPTRLKQDLSTMLENKVGGKDGDLLKRAHIRVESPPHRKTVVFLGASTLANMLNAMHPDVWLTRSEYRENGARILYKLG